jgi:hypothetical protein
MTPDFSQIHEDMPKWWGKICPPVEESIEEGIKKEWCGNGLGGIVLIMLGLREWGHVVTQSEDSD